MHVKHIAIVICDNKNCWYGWRIPPSKKCWYALSNSITN